MVESILHGNISIDRLNSSHELNTLSIINDTFEGVGYENHSNIIKDEPFILKMINDKTNLYFKDDKLSPVILGLMKEYLYRRRNDLIASFYGYYLRDKDKVRHAVVSGRRQVDRLTGSIASSSEQRDKSSDRSHSPGRITAERHLDAMNASDPSISLGYHDKESVILYTITSYEESNLQEWVLWHLVMSSIDHIVIYLSHSLEDHSFDILQPFIEAGYVSVIDILLEPTIHSFMDIHPILPEHDHLSTANDVTILDANCHILSYLSHHKERLGLHAMLWLGYASVSELIVFPSNYRQDGDPLKTDKFMNPLMRLKDNDEDVNEMMRAKHLRDQMQDKPHGKVINPQDLHNVDSKPTTSSTAAGQSEDSVTGMAISRIEFGHSDHLLIPRNELVTHHYRYAKVNVSSWIAESRNSSHDINDGPRQYSSHAFGTSHQIWRKFKISLHRHHLHPHYYTNTDHSAVGGMKGHTSHHKHSRMKQPDMDFIHIYLPLKGRMHMTDMSQIRIHHYYTKSVEYFTKRWILAHGHVEDRHRSNYRFNSSHIDDAVDPYHIPSVAFVDILTCYSKDWKFLDESAVPGAELMRTLLFQNDTISQ